jgi:hypothetical protein
LLLSLTILSCKQFEKYVFEEQPSQQQQPVTIASTNPTSEISSEYDANQILKVLQRANFDFYNALIYKDEKSWEGTLVSLAGNMVEQPVITSEQNVIQLIGTSGGDYADIVAYLDHPLPMQMTISEQVHLLTRGRSIRIFGVLQTCKDFVDKYGQRLYLPTMECLLIYDQDDRFFSEPLWISDTLKKRREGEVIIEKDSIKYYRYDPDSLKVEIKNRPPKKQ